MELIVVIVILAILAAILIPGLLKWIDQAKDKKYELEAREIALAAEAALAQMYAQGAGALDLVEEEHHYLLLRAGESTDLKGFLGEELEKFTDAAVEKIEIYGNSDGGTPEKWGGSATGFEITFKASDDAEIKASLLPGSDRWDINKSSDGTGGESGDKFDNDPDQNIREANAVGKAVKKALAQTEGVVELTHRMNGTVAMKGGDGYTSNNFIFIDTFKEKLDELYPDVYQVYVWAETFDFNEVGGDVKTWDGSIDRLYINYISSDGNDMLAKYYSSTDSWYCYDPMNRNDFDAWMDEVNGYVTP